MMAVKSDAEGHGSAYEVVTPTGKINRHRRRQTTADARGVGHYDAQKPPQNTKRKSKQKAAKQSRKRNRRI